MGPLRVIYLTEQRDSFAARLLYVFGALLLKSRKAANAARSTLKSFLNFELFKVSGVYPIFPSIGKFSSNSLAATS